MIHSNVKACSIATKHIMCVDDNEAVLGSLRMLLGHFGFQVSGFTCQAEALTALSDTSSAFDLMVVDQNMPGVKGIDVARQAKLLRPNMPIVMTTGFADEDLRSEARGAHIDALLEKPLALLEFRKTIESLL